MFRKKIFWVHNIHGIILIEETKMQLKRKSKGFTLIELMVVIVIIGILVAIALPNFISAQDRAKISSVKANAHTVQTMLETYAVDYQGKYPSTRAELYTGANSTNNYWKELKNPFTAKTATDSVDILPGAVTATNGIAVGTAAGTVYFNPMIVGTNPITKYYIYGGDKTALQLIFDNANNSVFTLSNS